MTNANKTTLPQLDALQTGREARQALTGNPAVVEVLHFTTLEKKIVLFMNAQHDVTGRRSDTNDEASLASRGTI